MVVGWEELQDLNGVWSELSRVWEQIDEMKDKPWLSVQPRKLRQQMDLLLTQLKDLPARYHDYLLLYFLLLLIFLRQLHRGVYPKIFLGFCRSHIFTDLDYQTSQMTAIAAVDSDLDDLTAITAIWII